MTSDNSTATNGHDQRCSQRGSRVLISPLLKPVESGTWLAKARAYIPKWSELLAKLDPKSRCWKTSQICLLGMTEDGLDNYSETWPRSGMMRNGTAYRLPTLALRINETESGSWPTPTARDWKDCGSLENVPENGLLGRYFNCLLYTSPSPRDS